MLSTMWNAILIIFIENKLPILCQSSTFITVSAASSTETTVVAKSRESGKQESTTSKVKSTKAGYTATLVACGWAGAAMEKVTGLFGQKL